ncbi:hypothetical protein F7725_018851 [Dissostichus mawsoni]|uniref:Uncharacterized protein n=1 Tax=Dissostichus mawsoni TaxID=36200 RepID=A0A7J5XSM8_DISMA|nr:hypothetical protein F7725_018851 [Dissostichus mawsoni]
MEDPANRRNSVLTSQNSSLSSLDYSDLTLSLPAFPTSEAGDREERSGGFESMAVRVQGSNHSSETVAEEHGDEAASSGPQGHRGTGELGNQAPLCLA